MAEEIRNGNIADNIFAELRRKILSGELKAGERLSGERELAQKYGTNRNTLREAVRKLEQARLVTVRHGQGVTVADFRKTGTLDLLSPFLQASTDSGDITHVIEDILEPRVLLLEHATRLAVRRADKQDIERLMDINDLLIAAFDSGDAVVVARGFQRWLDALIDAGHSLIVRWFANPMLDAYRDMVERYPALWVLEPSFPKHLRDVIHAISEGNEEKAVDATRAYYVRVDGALRNALVPASRREGGAEPELAEGANDPEGTVVPMRRRKSPA
ncbi:MAG TPA: GntR family transcriptional regulator [Polyangiaceae bacterium]|nr:GntR family transcriptional regulator [Polyangiaceae bacterium]